MTVKNRVTVITGATGGLGRVVTRHLAKHGAQLALFGRNLERLDGLANELGMEEDGFLTHEVDLTDPIAVQAAADAVIGKFGRVEILLHLVGGWVGGKAVQEVEASQVSDMLGQHLWTSFHLAQAFIPHLISNQWGRKIIVSSPFASQPAAKGAPYAIGKAAQETLMLTLAQELKGSGVTANILLVHTIDVNHKRARDPSPKNASWTTPEEIVAAILYLCSDEGQMVNGARIPLYGSP